MIYSNGSINILNHDVARAVSALVDAARNRMMNGFDGDFELLAREIRECVSDLAESHQQLLDTIEVDNAVSLVIFILQAENLLIQRLGTTQSISTSEIDMAQDNVDENIDEDELDYDRAVAIANLCWHKRISIRDLAVHLNVSEKRVRAIRSSESYLVAVEDVIMTTRSPAERITWIETYPKVTMPSRFSRRMGLLESEVTDIIEKVLERSLEQVANESGTPAEKDE